MVRLPDVIEQGSFCRLPVFGLLQKPGEIDKGMRTVALEYVDDFPLVVYNIGNIGEVAIEAASGRA